MRPKDIAEIVADFPGSVPATVEVVEPLGARVPPNGRITSRQLVHPAFAADQRHFFEAGTGGAIR